MMPHITGLDVLIAAILAILCVTGAAVVIRVLKAEDPGSAEDDPEWVRNLPAPRPMMHEAPTVHDAVWHQLPVAPPAAGLAPGAPAGPGPGDAAAAGDGTPPASPPPLPDGDITEAAQFAIDNPGREPFELWQLDAFVDAYNAIQKERA